MSAEQPATPTAKRWSQRVLLIGWDAADWKMIEPLIERGELPNLARFLDEGIMGNVASLRPMLSPILWTSIATGKHADKHGILGFAEPDPHADGIRPVTSTSRRCKALWNIISDAGMKAGVVNWFASHPTEPINGFVVSDRYPTAVGPLDEEWPAVQHSVHPAALLEPACRLRVHPAMVNPRQLKEFLPTLGSWDATTDKHVAELRGLLAQCATVHMAATWLMQEQEWDFCGVYYDAIDRFAHGFMEFHPPRMEHVEPEAFERYREVMTACYRFHDMMLGRQMELAGDDATIILLSDHGFHCDELRPAGSSAIDANPVAWHRQHGIVALRGPCIKKDERLYGASLLDIAPTVLMLLGLPVARDMDGQPLRQVLSTDISSVRIPRIPTYDTEEAAAPIVDYREDPWANEQMLAQLEALGYIERSSGKQRERIVLDRERNLGQVFSSTDRPSEALQCYDKVLAAEPDDVGTKMAKAMCHLQLRDYDACEAVAREVLDAEDDAPRAQLIMGIIAFHRGNVTESLAHLRAAERDNPELPGLHRQIGSVYLRRRRWKDAERNFARAIELNPHDPEAYDGLGVAYRRQRRSAEAVEQHMRSISLLHYRPTTHVHLGLALAEVGQFDWAIRAFHVALELNPMLTLAHRCLAQLYERAKDDPERAAEHRRYAVRSRNGRAAQQVD